MVLKRPLYVSALYSVALLRSSRKTILITNKFVSTQKLIITDLMHNKDQL